jgi:glycosyltransferase involved in cell wall biosynthesis
MKTVLMTAYDIDPYFGSESGTGWNFVIQGARFNKIIAITRENNRGNIERYINENKISTLNIFFLYFDLPYMLRFWKIGSRGSSVYFYLWQLLMPLYIKRIKIHFDILHNVNFHTDSFPTFLWILRKPLIWGPINHNELIPKQYINSRLEYFKDRFKWYIKKFIWKFDPFLYLSKYFSKIIIVGNSSVKKIFQSENEKVITLSQVGCSRNANFVKKHRKDKYRILIAGRFLSIKSFDIGILAFDDFYNELSPENKNNVELIIIGKGELENDLKNIVSKIKSKGSIKFLNWLPHSEMVNYYQNSNLFSFPSHEGAGMVVIEALSYGLPIVCFDNFGPGEFVTNECAFKIPYSNYSSSIKAFSQAYMDLFVNLELESKMSVSAHTHFNKNHTWESKGDFLRRLYEKI